jgi:hypothetical protein
MTASADPTVHRLVLRRQLKEARIRRGSSQAEAALALGWPVGDFLRVEAVEDGVADGRLLALLDHYGIVDGTRESFAAVQAAGALNALLRPEVRLLFEHERAAAVIYTFESQFVPGLLQTRAYAEAVLGLLVGPEEVGPFAEARVARQDLLDRGDAPEMFFLLDEAVLRRPAGGPEVMREQLDQLRRLARKPRVHIRIVPFGAGLHDGVKGPFVILEFADPALRDLLYLEDWARGDRLGLAETMHFARFWALHGTAAEPGLDHFLDRAREDLDDPSAA